MMSKETVNYGNWVPKKMIVALLTFGLICLVIALVPVPVVVRIIFGVLAALGLVGFLYFTYAYHVFSSGGGNLQAHLWDIVIEKLPWDGNGKSLGMGTGNAWMLEREMGHWRYSQPRNTPKQKSPGSTIGESRGITRKKCVRVMRQSRASAIGYTFKKPALPVCPLAMENSTRL